MLSTIYPPDVIVGEQRPRILHVPPHVTSAGEEAIELAASAGLYLDDPQQLVLRGGLGERADGKWSAFEVGVEEPRQNGKGGILEARELSGLFLFRERLIVHSAHLFETSMNHMERMLRLIESNRDLERGVDRVSRAHGQEGITLTPRFGRCQLKFKTRTKGGGRGLSGDCVVLDEAMELSAASLAALMPTLSARPNPQLWYAGSAVDQMIHANGLVFARVRARALRGDDPSLAYFGWSVDPDEYNADPQGVAADPRYWAIANPALGRRITLEYVANEHRSLPPREFATERLGVGDWPDTSDGADQFLPMWGELQDDESVIEGPVAFVFDVTPERDFASIGTAGRRADGRWHVEVIENRAGTGWVVDELVRMRDEWSPCVIAYDGKGPAASLVPDLEAAGLRRFDDKPHGDRLLWEASPGDMAKACGVFYDAAVERSLRHLGQSWLSQALRSAKKRDLADAWAWARKSGGDISPLVSVTLAMRAHQLFAGAGRKPFVLR